MSTQALLAKPRGARVGPADKPAASEPQDAAPGLGGLMVLDLVVELAHDLRSPLASIGVLAEALQSGDAGPINDLQRRQLGLIRSAALCLSVTASDVLEMARGRRTTLDCHPLPFSLREVFENVRDIVSPLVEWKKVELRLATIEPDQRWGYGGAIGRVLLNLATNALKAMDTGYIELAARADGPTRLRFAVRDTGPGIDQDALPALYEPFHRRSPFNRPYFSSSGLGLAICRRLVAAMGAELRVETSRNWGTEFSFTLELPPAPVPTV